MPPAVKNEQDKRLDKRNTMKTKSSMASPKKQKELRASETTNKYSRKGIKKSNTRSMVRGIKLSKRMVAQPKLVEPERYKILENLPVNTVLETAMEEIESNGSSSESEESSKESEANEEQANDLNLEQKSILELDIHSDVISLSEEEVDYVNENQIETEIDFFDVFGEVPHIDEVSLDLTDDLIVEEPIASVTEPVVIADTGTFIDPLTEIRVASLATAESIKSTIVQLTSFEKSRLEETEIEEEKSLNLKEDTLPEDIFAEPADGFENVRASAEVADETFQLFLEKIKQQETQIVNETELPEEALISEEEKRANQTIVMDFLKKLTDHCVSQAEQFERDTILRNFLDKKKLMNELKSKYDALELERNKTQFLNQKTVHFLKRKGSFRLISAEEVNTLALNRKKFYTVLSDLDQALTTEEKTKTNCSIKILDLKQQFEEAKQKSNEEIDKLEQLVKSTFQRKVFDKLQTSVDKYLTKMSAARNEISKVRLGLLLQQHQFSVLKKELNELEDLGNGLNVQHFESLETETYAVSKKIEEHNSVLKRLHSHCNDDVHKMAHLKEKQKMLRSIAAAQKQYLEELMQEKRELRQYITQVKLQRNRCRYETHDLSYHSGLLAKPALIKDYDKTVEKANKLQQTNEDLRTTILELNTKIALLEEN